MGAGYYVNINDVSGPYSSVVFGISNSFGSIPGKKNLNLSKIKY